MVTVFSLFTTNGKRRSFINFVTWINRLTDVITLSNGVTWRIQQKKRFLITRYKHRIEIPLFLCSLSYKGVWKLKFYVI